MCPCPGDCEQMQLISHTRAWAVRVGRFEHTVGAQTRMPPGHPIVSALKLHNAKAAPECTSAQCVYLRNTFNKKTHRPDGHARTENCEFM